MKLIKLTNSNQVQGGEALLINADCIVSVVRGVATREDNVLENVTYVFIPPHGTWEVRESLDEIMELANS